MRLPEIERAIIEPTKLRDYLLSRSHPIGRFKAAFFATLGYHADDWPQLEEDLRALIAAAEASEVASTRYGRKYEVRGILKGPSGRTAELVTIWVVLSGDEVPRLVTAYPGFQP